MDKIELLKAIRTWNENHYRNGTLAEAKDIVQMLEDIKLIYFIRGGTARPHPHLTEIY